LSGKKLPLRNLRINFGPQGLSLFLRGFALIYLYKQQGGEKRLMVGANGEN